VHVVVDNTGTELALDLALGRLYAARDVLTSNDECAIGCVTLLSCAVDGLTELGGMGGWA
jgi:hypothetical protein